MTIIDPAVLSVMKTQSNESVLDISKERPIMLVFLRHFGCQFCREAMDDVSKLQPHLAALDIKLVLVHMAEDSIAESYFRQFNLVGVPHISDPKCRFYTLFGLVNGNFTQIFGIQAWIRGFSVKAKYGREIGKHLGSNFQLPGVFIISNGEVKDSYIHKNVSDRPDYDSLINSISLN
jgi:peroxiredoxin